MAKQSRFESPRIDLQIWTPNTTRINANYKDSIVCLRKVVMYEAIIHINFDGKFKLLFGQDASNSPLGTNALMIRPVIFHAIGLHSIRKYFSWFDLPAAFADHFTAEQSRVIVIYIILQRCRALRYFSCRNWWILQHSVVGNAIIHLRRLDAGYIFWLQSLPSYMIVIEMTSDFLNRRACGNLCLKSWNLVSRFLTFLVVSADWEHRWISSNLAAIPLS